MDFSATMQLLLKTAASNADAIVPPRRAEAPALAVDRRALPRQLAPHADWVELEGIGHCPQPSSTSPALTAHR